MNSITEKYNLDTNAINQYLHDVSSPIAMLKLVNSIPEHSNDKSHLISAVQRVRDISNHLISSLEEQKETTTYKFYTLEEINSVVNNLVLQKKIEFSEHNNVDIFFNSTIDDSSTFSASFESSKIQRVLSNIINNSVEATNDNGLISVDTFILGEEHLVIEVKDNGCGIPSNVIPMLGKKQYSSKAPSNRGYGLTHAFKTIQALGGELLIKSINSSGTSIKIKLPLF